MKALVLGYGRSGKAAEALLKAQGYEVVVLDGDDKVPWDAVGDSDSCNKNVASPLDAAGDSVVRDKNAASPLDAGLEGTRHSCRVASVSAEGRDARKSLRAAEPPRPLTALRGSYFDNPVLRGNGACAIGLMRAEAEKARAAATTAVAAHTQSQAQPTQAEAAEVTEQTSTGRMTTAIIMKAAVTTQTAAAAL